MRNELSVRSTHYPSLITHYFEVFDTITTYICLGIRVSPEKFPPHHRHCLPLEQHPVA
jgi:hypothetical protein